MNFNMSALAAGLCLLRGKPPCFVAGTLSHHAAAFAQHRPRTPPYRCRHSDGILERSRRRARRRATRSAKLRMIAEGVEGHDVATATGPTTATRYTIDDSVCPPTDPERLRDIVEKHVCSLPSFWRSKPVAGHTRRAFDECLDWIRASASNMREDGERVGVVLDSGCGTGRSSLVLGRRHPDCLVIGIDQSVARLSRNRAYHRPPDGPDGGNGNVMLVRAELGDFWRCMIGSDEWRGLCEVRRHYLLYPNPYPKASRLKSRFYCSPSFPYLMMTLDMGGGGGDAAGGERLTVRSNWRGYLNEFRDAAMVYGETGADLGRWLAHVEAGGEDGWRPGGAGSPCRPGRLRAEGPVRLDRGDVEPITNFEAKYVEVGEPIYELSFHSAPMQEEEEEIR